MAFFRINKNIVLILMLIALACFAMACSDSDKPDSEQSGNLADFFPDKFKPGEESAFEDNPTLSEKEKPAEEESLPDLTEPEYVLDIYTNEYSEEFHKWDGQVEKVDSSLKSEISTSLRIRALEDGVILRLEQGTWNVFHSYFEVDEDIFTIVTEKDKIYEFDAPMAETMPYLQLTVEYRGLSYVWPLQYDMVGDEGPVTSIVVAPWRPSPPEMTTNMLNLCLAYAISFYLDLFEAYEAGGAYASGQVSAERLWKTVTWAITYNHNEAVAYLDDSIYVRENILKSYAAALFPEQDKLPPLPDYISKDSSTPGWYIVQNYYYPIAWDLIYTYQADSDDKNWMVAISIEDVENGRDELPVMVYITENGAFDRDNPFGYHITGAGILGGNTP